jgi:hypothetical protein
MRPPGAMVIAVRIGFDAARWRPAVIPLFSFRTGLRFQHDFDTAVLHVHEQLIALGRVLKTHAVRDHEAGIDISVLNPFENGRK